MTDTEAMVAGLRLFTERWRLNPHNGDEIYELIYLEGLDDDRRPASAKITASGLDAVADALEALAKNRAAWIGDGMEYAAVIAELRNTGGLAVDEVWERWRAILSAVPSDVLREHDERVVREAVGEPIAYAIYGRSTGRLKDVAEMTEEQVEDLSRFYDVVPLYRLIEGSKADA